MAANNNAQQQKVRFKDYKSYLLYPLPEETAIRQVEVCARICYRSKEDDLNTAKELLRKLWKNGHHSVFEHVGITAFIRCDRGLCYDEETKVLTTDGWKFFRDVTLEDTMYSLDDSNHLIKIKPSKLIKEEYDGEMHWWHSTQVDLAVTPNHNMWLFDYEKRVDKSWKFIKSKDANNGRYKFMKSAERSNSNWSETIEIPGCVINHGICQETYEALSLDAILFYELLGWWLTDGSISYGNNGGSNRIQIAQTKIAGQERLLELVEALKLDYWIDEKQMRINCPQLFQWLANNFIRSREDVRKTYYLKLPRAFINSLSPLSIDALLAGIIGGDGTPHTVRDTAYQHGYQIYTASRDFAEDIVELCLLSGRAANIYVTPPRERTFPNGAVSQCKEQYVVSVVTTTEPMFCAKTARKETIHYKGNVYCVELPEHHRLYVMRNGKACWCGNSHELVRHRIGVAFSQESTRYCAYDKEIEFVLPSNMQGHEDIFRAAADIAATNYKQLLSDGIAPQTARGVLPNDLVTRLYLTANLREWMHIFALRLANPGAHPDMRRLMSKVADAFLEQYPELFGDILGLKDIRAAYKLPNEGAELSKDSAVSGPMETTKELP